MLSGLQLAYASENSVEQVDRLETCNHDRHFVARADRLVFSIPHNGADMAWTEECLDPIDRRLKDRGHNRRDQYVRSQHRKIRDPFLLCAPDSHRIRGRCRFKTDSKEHNSPGWIRLGDFQAIERRIDNANIRATGF